MRHFFNCFALFFTLLGLQSCAVADDAPISNDGYYDDGTKAERFMPLLEGETASLQGSVDGHEAISVVATGSKFQISSFPSSYLMQYFPESTICQQDGINVLTDVVNYSHPQFNSEILAADSLSLTIAAHTLDFAVQSGGIIHKVSVEFDSSQGSIKWVRVPYASSSSNYWQYSFMLHASRMKVDDIISEEFVPKDYPVILFFNRYKDMSRIR